VFGHQFAVRGSPFAVRFQAWLRANREPQVANREKSPFPLQKVIGSEPGAQYRWGRVIQPSSPFQMVR